MDIYSGQPVGGYQIRSSRRSVSTGRTVLLGHNPDAVQPWGTWLADRDDESCYWGHYFREEKDARADYWSRS
jgi:hypothetical protein